MVEHGLLTYEKRNSYCLDFPLNSTIKQTQFHLTTLSKFKPKNKKLTMKKLVICYLERIKHLNPDLNSVIFINENVLSDAHQLDLKIEQNQL